LISSILIHLPVIHIPKRVEQAQLDVLHSWAESFQFIIIIQERSWLFVGKNLLVLYPEFCLFGWRERAGEFGNYSVEFDMLEESV
jgi:hypothetical protein